jgi:hypothetical protein
MGRDLLAQDYILKQITASLIYPEEGIGKEFWAEVYRRAQDQFGTTDIPVDTFNKVWIMPDVAEVYQKDTSAMVLKAHLKVMLEADYLAIENNAVGSAGVSQASGPTQELTKQILRQIIVPVLEKEVNEGRNFARLRQIYNALILAAWYKRTMRETFLGRSYVDQNKVKGIEQQDPGDNLRIYAQYVEALHKGVFNYVKEEIDSYSGEVIPRKYLSGGVFVQEDFSDNVLVVRTGTVDFSQDQDGSHDEVTVGVAKIYGNTDHETGASIPARLKDKHNKYQKIFLSKPDELFTSTEKETMVATQNESQELAVAYFEQAVFAGQEQKDLVMRDVVKPLIKGPWSPAQSLLLSGTYTDQAAQYILILSKLASRRSAVPYYEILGLFGLRSDLKSLVAAKLSESKSIDDIRVFYEKMFLELFPKDSFFKKERKEGEDFSKDLIDLRKSDPEWNKEFYDTPSKKRLIDKMVSRAKVQFLRAQSYGQNAAKGVAATLTRVKSYISLEQKYYNSRIGDYDFEKDAMKEKRKSFIDIFDMLGSMVIDHDGMKEMEQKMALFESKSVFYDEWKNAIDKEEIGLNNQKRNEKNKRVIASIDDQLRELADRKANLKDNQGRYIIIRKDNRYLTQLKAKKAAHFRGMNYVVALGVGNDTEEIRFTNFASVLDSVDHDNIYKSKMRRSRKFALENEVLEAIWLFHIVDGLNYLYQDKKVGPHKVIKFLNDASQSSAPGKNEALFVKPSEVTGGIDVRNLDGALDVTGTQGGFAVDMSNRAFGPVDGFSPRILSITPVDGLPFLQEHAPPGTVFSKN